MDLSELKKESDLSFDIANAKKNALERAESRKLIVYNYSIFSADPETINLVNVLKQHFDTFIILDNNSNPCKIDNPDEFLNILIQRNQEALNEYHRLYETLKRKS